VPFYKLCYNKSVYAENNDYLNENELNLSLLMDTIHSITPTHMLAIN